jgi:hypothetical protein
VRGVLEGFVLQHVFGRQATLAFIADDLEAAIQENNMKQKLEEHHNLDAAGNPAGGRSKGVGFDIEWQDGPLGRGADRKDPNGAFVEGIVQAAIGRLHFYQSSKFSCRENAIALTHLETALLWLGKRTADREEREVEGTNVK